MIADLAAVAGGLAVASALMILVLVVRRVWLARGERERRARETRVLPIALALLDGEGEEGLEALAHEDLEALGKLLMRYSRSVSGDALERIASFCESRGLVDEALSGLTRRRAWRRAAAAFALGDTGSPRAGPALLRALSDPNREVRTAAARSLGSLGAEAAARPLALTLAAGTVPAAVVGQALLRLGAGAAPRLRALLDYEDTAVRAAAVELLGLVGEAADAPDLVDRLRDPAAEVRARACQALARVGAEDAVAELRAALEDRIPFVRTRAAHALGLAGDRAAIPSLLVQAHDGGYDSAHAAAEALAQIAPDALAGAARLPNASEHILEAADLLAVGPR